MAKKFIDVDVLAKQIYKRVNNSAIRSWLFAIINETLAADVQEVVKCKDCYLRKMCYIRQEDIICSDYGYCSRGKRMDGEENDKCR